MPKMALPKPRWYKSDSNLLPRYVKFLEKHYAKYRTQLINDEQRHITTLAASIETCQTNFAILDAIIKRRAEKIDALKRTIVTFTDDQLADEYDMLTCMPEVAGTHIDEKGALVVWLRPKIYGKTEGVFACDFQIADDGCLHNTVVLRYIPTYDRRSIIAHIVQMNPDSYGKFQITLPLRSAYSTYLRKGQLNEAVADLLRNFNTDHAFYDKIGSHPASSVIPSTLPVAQDPNDALRKRLDDCINKPTRTTIQHLEFEQAADKLRQGEIVRQLRANQADLNRKTNELERLQAIMRPADQKIDIAWAADQLWRITTQIPGVMGMRFDPQGVAVVHVRTSVVHHNRRYDFGDYELHFTLGGHLDGVIKVDQTRSPYLQRFEHIELPYWITGDYFCFGQRRKELYKLFIEGDFAQFVHIAINSMNSVNDDIVDDFRFCDFQEIPIDEVWVNRPRRRPRRPVATTHALPLK